MDLGRALRAAWLPAAGLLLVFTWPAAAQLLERGPVDTWATTTCYLGYAEFAEATDGRIRIAAADRYDLYLNGDRVGGDDDPGSAEVYDVEFRRRTNMVAVVVGHEGTPASEYGLFCVLETDGGPMASSPTDRGTPWFWTDFALANEEQADWTTLRLNELSDHQESDQAVIWRAVQAGTLDPAGFPEFADLDLPEARSIAGFPGGLDGSRGGLRLRSFEGQNLAFNTFSREPRLIDGDVRSPKSYGKGGRALFEEVEVDLGRLFPINRVRVITQPPGSSGTYEDNSLRGYSILVSKDGVNYLNVGSRNQITDFTETSVDFPTTIARFVRMVVTEFANRNAIPKVGELEVFGEGIDRRGTYLSPPLDLGSTARKNFDRALLYGDLAGTGEIAIQARSGDDGQTWSAWSAWSRDTEIQLNVPEPRRFLQFRVLMETSDSFASPRLDSLVVLFGGAPLPVTEAVASIVPLQAPIGVDTTFTYSLGLEIDSLDSGVGRLVILTPWPAQLDPAGVTGAVTIDPDRTYSTGDSLVISFDPPVDSDVEIEIPFTSRLLSASHTFQGLLYAPDAGFSLSVQPRAGEDPLTGQAYSVVSEATSFDLPLLQDVRPFPVVLTPNGDGINDRLGFGFTLGRVSSAPVRVEIYHLDGGLVRTLPERPLSAGYYGPAGGERAEFPFSWDGRGRSGELLPPGLYLYRLVVDTEPEAEAATGVVAIAY